MFDHSRHEPDHLGDLDDRDAVQKALVQVMDGKAGYFPGRTPVGAWLYSLAY